MAKTITLRKDKRTVLVVEGDAVDREFRRNGWTPAKATERTTGGSASTSEQTESTASATKTSAGTASATAKK